MEEQLICALCNKKLKKENSIKVLIDDSEHFDFHKARKVIIGRECLKSAFNRFIATDIGAIRYDPKKDKIIEVFKR